jgi:hypothetical protein
VTESLEPIKARQHAARRSIRTVNTFVLCVSAAVLAVSFWKRNDLPSAHELLPELVAEPLQRTTDKPPFTAEYAGVQYNVEPKFTYDLHGMVVSYRQHDGESLMHKRANDHLNMADLCVTWGETAASPHLNEISFWNGIFTCNFQTSSRTAWESIRPQQISNNHLLSADDLVRRQVSAVKIGDQVHIRGWLASYGNGGHHRGTSTTREDTGDGACEVIFVDDFEIVRAAFGPWRAAMYASLLALVASLIVYFRLPYRPYA